MKAGKTRMNSRSLLLVLGLLLITQTAQTASRLPVRSQGGMVVSASDLASQVGVAMLDQGGNAVDAAVAVGFALAVTFPSAGNLGGGGFMVIYLAEPGRATTIDYRETAAASASRDMYLDADGNVIERASTDGHRSVAVPGTVAGLLLALESYGSLSRQQVLAPAIRLAAQGFTIDPYLEASLERSRERLASHPESERIFLNAGSGFVAGDRLVQPELAATLTRIAEQGAAGFYQGPTADLLVAEMQRGGGLITADDLESYQPRERAPVTGSYRGYQIISMAPPSSGGTILIEMLNMMEPLDVAGLGLMSSVYVHNVAEVMKRAFADRAEYMGDPDFVEVPAGGLTRKSYAVERRADISADRTVPATRLGAGDPWPYESEETTHFSIIDAAGNAVSNTYTLNYSYGSGVTVTGAGFLLNNIMDNFAAKQGVPNGYGLIQGAANSIAAGKRPLSSMTPSIVLEDGDVRLVAGTPGGPTIINTVFQVIMNVLDFGLNAQQAVDQPRFHHQWLPDAIQYEPRALVNDVIQALEAKGHQVQERGLIGDAQVIYVDPEDGWRYGGSDPRRGGQALGQ
jgi:gamma-glutamyltranspeptidase / glutathione hydrolase